MARFFKLLVLVPVGLLVLAFAIANRQTVTVSFDPFATPETAAALVTAPLFILLFLALLLGIVLGGSAAWISQGSNRRKARLAREEAEEWRDEVRRLRSQPPVVAAGSGRSLIAGRG